MTSQRPAVEMSSRVGILLGPVDDLNTRVVRFLILHLNTLQNSIEFEFIPPQNDSELLSFLDSKRPVDRRVAENLAGQFLVHYQPFWELLRAGYGLPDAPPSRVIILSTARFSDNYYTMSAGSVAVVALGNWKRYMAPPSLVEFFVFIALRLAAGLVDSNLTGSVHLGTRGCLFDFTASLDDVRYQVLVGSLCSRCAKVLQMGPLSRLEEELPRIMGKEWLGKREDPRSPASICAKLGYDLFVSTGPTSTFRESLQAALQHDGPKELIKWVFAVLLACVLFWAGLRAP